MKLIERRVGLLFALFALAFAVILLRAGWLQAIKGGEYRADARSQQVASVLVPGIRGSILDRRGNPLALSEEAATVIATPYQVENPTRTAAKLGEVLDISPEEILPSLATSSGFEYVAKDIDLVTAKRVEKLGLPGIATLPDSRRVYPLEGSGARLIGAVGSEGEGLWGIEQSEDATLRGTDGELSVTKDALGQEIGRDIETGAEAGGDVRLTIDGRIQSYSEGVLDGIAEKYTPKRATTVAMDPQTGEILAMASWPPIDPNDLSDVDPDELSNMATAFTYEPGSTFKAFTVAGALQEKLVNPETRFDVPGEITVADRVIGESHEVGYRNLSVAEILAQSSNVGTVMIGRDQLGEKKFGRWVDRFGFGAPTGIDYPGEEQGIVPRPKDYSGASIGNLPIGQGLSVTPLQMMTAYAAIANGGVLRTPSLVESVDGETVPRAEGERVISKRTASEVRSMLEGVTAPGGTASEVEVPGYVLAGKTGTSQKVEDGTYSETKFIASFVGFAPAADPRLLVAVIVDEPQGDYYGGSVAAPAFGEIASFALPYLGIPPTS